MHSQSKPDSQGVNAFNPTPWSRRCPPKNGIINLSLTLVLNSSSVSRKPPKNVGLFGPNMPRIRPPMPTLTPTRTSDDAVDLEAPQGLMATGRARTSSPTSTRTLRDAADRDNPQGRMAQASANASPLTAAQASDEASRRKHTQGLMATGRMLRNPPAPWIMPMSLKAKWAWKQLMQRLDDAAVLGVDFVLPLSLFLPVPLSLRLPPARSPPPQLPSLRSLKRLVSSLLT